MSSLSNRDLKHNPFLSPGEYSTCHIGISESDERIAAIAVNQQYYSFFKSVKDREKALSVFNKLQEKGNDALIIKNPKGYSVWVLELTAYLIKSKR